MDVTTTPWVHLLFWLVLGGLEPGDSPALTADAYLDGLPESCELLVAFDTREADAGLAEVRRRWSRPELLSVPDVVDGLSAVDDAIATTMGQVQALYGLDPIGQLDAFSLCVNLGAGSSGLPEPFYVVSLRGTAGFADGFVTLLRSSLEPVPGTTALVDPVWGTMAFLPSPDQLLIGSRGYLEPLLAAGATSPSPRAGSVNAHLAELAPYGVRWFLGFAPSMPTRFLIAGWSTPSMAEHLSHLNQAILAGNDDTLMVQARLNSAAGTEDFEIMGAGLGALARATPLLFEAFTSLILGSARPGDRAWSEQVLALEAHRTEVMTMLRESGAFEPPTVTQETDPTAHTVTVTLDDSRGFQLLMRQLVLLGAMAAEGQLPETVRSFENLPIFWGRVFSTEP